MSLVAESRYSTSATHSYMMTQSEQKIIYCCGNAKAKWNEKEKDNAMQWD